MLSKTCTGFTGGVEVDSVDIINKHKSDLIEIKASGGIKSRKDMITMIEAGASRIGTSHGVKIMNDNGSEVNK